MANRRLGPKRRIKLALEQVTAEIRGYVQSGTKPSAGMPHYAGGLSTEGYSGGYRDALSDVTLLLNGVVPNRRDYWRIPAAGTPGAPDRG